MNADETLTNLLVVSKLNLNDKLSYDGTNFNIRPNTNTRALLRYLYGENRQHTFLALKALFSAAINLVELFNFREDAVGAKRISNALQLALKGLQNLTQTYRDDDNIASKFSMLSNDIETFLISIAILSPAPTTPSSLVSSPQLAPVVSPPPPSPTVVKYPRKSNSDES